MITHKEITEIKTHLDNNEWDYQFSHPHREGDLDKALHWLERQTFGYEVLTPIVRENVEDLVDKPTTLEMAQFIANDVAFAKMDAHGVLHSDFEDDGYILPESAIFELQIL